MNRSTTEASAGKASILRELGEISYRSGHLAVANEYLDQALRQSTFLQDEALKADVLTLTGTVALARGDESYALRCNLAALSGRLLARIPDYSRNFSFLVSQAQRDPELFTAQMAEISDSDSARTIVETVLEQLQKCA